MQMLKPIMEQNGKRRHCSQHIHTYTQRQTLNLNVLLAYRRCYYLIESSKKQKEIFICKSRLYQKPKKILSNCANASQEVQAEEYIKISSIKLEREYNGNTATENQLTPSTTRPPSPPPPSHTTPRTNARITTSPATSSCRPSPLTLTRVQYTCTH